MNSYRQVLIYVEGPSDVEGLKILFSQLIEEKQQTGITIRFIPSGGKKKLLTQNIKRAVNTVLNAEYTDVVLMPDLYPKNMGLQHDTVEQLVASVQEQLEGIISQKSGANRRILDRINIFCFKHDFECLVLAAKEQLKAHLGKSRLPVSWNNSVEDQNHDDPPKRVVERIFESCGQKYVATEDAFEILAGADYRTLAGSCPEGFKPLADYLEGL